MAKNLSRIVKFSLIFIVVALLFTSCATIYQAYPGPEISKNQEAIIIIGRWHDTVTGRANLQVDMVDGRQIQNPPDKIALLPGDHTLGISGFASAGIFKESITPTDYNIHVEGGKTYRLFIDNPRNPVLVFRQES